MDSMQIALRKRPVELETIEKSASSIVRQLETTGEHEVPSREIGSMVMKALAQLDTVAYIRYASVYRDFRNPDDFNIFLEELEHIHEKNKAAAEEQK